MTPAGEFNPPPPCKSLCRGQWRVGLSLQMPPLNPPPALRIPPGPPYRCGLPLLKIGCFRVTVVQISGLLQLGQFWQIAKTLQFVEASFTFGKHNSQSITLQFAKTLKFVEASFMFCKTQLGEHKAHNPCKSQILPKSQYCRSFLQGTT